MSPNKNQNVVSVPAQTPDGLAQDLGFEPVSDPEFHDLLEPTHILDEQDTQVLDYALMGEPFSINDLNQDLDWVAKMSDKKFDAFADRFPKLRERILEHIAARGRAAEWESTPAANPEPGYEDLDEKHHLALLGKKVSVEQAVKNSERPVDPAIITAAGKTAHKTVGKEWEELRAKFKASSLAEPEGSQRAEELRINRFAGALLRAVKLHAPDERRDGMREAVEYIAEQFDVEEGVARGWIHTLIENKNVDLHNYRMDGHSITTNKEVASRPIQHSKATKRRADRIVEGTVEPRQYKGTVRIPNPANQPAGNQDQDTA